MSKNTADIESLLPPVGAQLHCSSGSLSADSAACCWSEHLVLCLLPSEGGSWGQSPRGGRATAHREGETLPEGGAGAPGEEEGEEGLKVQSHTEELSADELIGSNLLSASRRSWKGLAGATPEKRLVWSVENGPETRSWSWSRNTVVFVLSICRRTSERPHRSTAPSAVRVRSPHDDSRCRKQPELNKTKLNALKISG